MMRKCRLNRPSRPFSRLASVPPLKLPLLALSLTAALALVLAACGGGSGLLSGTTASEINSNLERVRDLVSEGNCSGADEAVAEVSTQVEALEGVDSRLKEALGEGVVRLEEVVAGCEEIETGEAAEALEEPEEEVEEKQQKPEKSDKEESTEREPTEKEPTAPEEGEPTTPEGEEAEPPEESEPPSGGVGPAATPEGEG